MLGYSVNTLADYFPLNERKLISLGEECKDEKNIENKIEKGIKNYRKT